jgi:radical SAM superfamily enzyme YgiQ (UPF0313 family)
MSDVVMVFPKTGIDIERTLQPPIGILYASSFLVKENYKVKVIDQRVDIGWKKTLSRELKGNPLCIGISSLTGKQIFNGIEISKFAKENCSDIPIIWGGVHPSLFPQQTLENKYIDIVVKGDGELTFLEVVKAIENNKSLKGIKGISYKNSNKLYHNEDRNFIDLNSIPEIPYDLVDIKNYLNARISNTECHLPFYTSRGCPHRCAFCYNNVFNKRTYRMMKPELVVERMKMLIEKYNIDSMTIDDDNFFVSTRRVEEICKLMKQEGIDLTWQSGCRLDYINKFSESFLNTLSSSGLFMLQLGAESGCQRILDLMKKDITVSDILNANKKLAKANIIPKYSFMAGFPTEKKEEMYETIDVMMKLIKDNPNCHFNPISIYTPYPGTELYELSIKDGFKPPESLERWGSFVLDWFNSNLWVDKKERKNLEDISYLTLFIDGKSIKEILKSKTNHMIDLGVSLYTHIARFKCKNHLFFSPEIKIIKKMAQVMYKFN